MPARIVGFKQKLAALRLRDFDPLERTVQAIAIGLGWLALVSLLSYGGLLLELTFDAAPTDGDRPYIDPGDIRGLLIDSALVLGGCAAIVVAAELLRRRRRVAR